MPEQYSCRCTSRIFMLCTQVQSSKRSMVVGGPSSTSCAWYAAHQGHAAHRHDEQWSPFQGEQNSSQTGPSEREHSGRTGAGTTAAAIMAGVTAAAALDPSAGNEPHTAHARQRQ
jgi:hypothetical protein